MRVADQPASWSFSSISFVYLTSDSVSLHNGNRKISFFLYIFFFSILGKRSRWNETFSRMETVRLDFSLLYSVLLFGDARLFDCQQARSGNLLNACDFKTVGYINMKFTPIYLGKFFGCFPTRFQPLGQIAILFKKEQETPGDTWNLVWKSIRSEPHGIPFSLTFSFFFSAL